MNQQKSVKSSCRLSNVHRSIQIIADKVLRLICRGVTWHKDQLINWKFVSILYPL